ncbi:MAG: 5-methylcytosine-specific restriction enzyme [Sphingomonadales bacterium]|nr:5-methylcytosine-specific restriction enzyme [Sphingomonadales bacterium]
METERRERNADWSREETILLMDLYLSAPRAGKTHPEVIALSTLLRAAGRRGGAAVSPTFRNPAGIAMRLRNFGRHDPQAPAGRDAGLRPGGAVDVQVWTEFGGDRNALTLEVARVRRSITADDWRPNPRSSRGPAPSFGPKVSFLSDGRTGVYLLLIDGPLTVLAPNLPEEAGRALVKIGRTGDLDRRMAELAGGLPPDAAIRYVPIGLRIFPDAARAHAFERGLLDLCDNARWSLGGEFVYAPLDALKVALTGG